MKDKERERVDRRQRENEDREERVWSLSREISTRGRVVLVGC